MTTPNVSPVSPDDEKKLIQNRPSPEGRMIGEQLARLCDKAEIEIRKQFPDHDERCKSCAFRSGTLPNGCLITVMDALKATLECHPFMCHQDFDAKGEPTQLCAGFVILMGSTHIGEIPAPIQSIVAKWEYST